MRPSFVLEMGLVVGLRDAMTLLRSGGRDGFVGRLEGGSGEEGRLRLGIGVRVFRLKF